MSTWDTDPFMHPEIQTMTLNRPADLPLRSLSTPTPDQPRAAKAAAGPGAGRKAVTALAAAVLAVTVAMPAGARAQSPEPAAAFAMPTDLDDWQPDIFGDNGIYRFLQVEGDCQITFIQNHGVDVARAGGHEPRDSIEAYIESVAANVGQVERSAADDLALKSDSGEPVPFVSAAFAYLGHDAVEHRNRISAAWVGDIELLIIAACPVSQWPEGQPRMDAFIGRTSVLQFSDP